jgi:ATP-dependent DNA helicase RecG
LKHLNLRQIKALRAVQKRGRISNSEYQHLNHISKPTATRDLQDLVKKAILKPSGIRGAGAFYEIIGSEG